MNIQTAIHHVASGNDLSEQQAHSVAKTIVAGDATPAQIGAILVGLRAKGETVEEILGVVRAMREQMTKVHVPGDSLVDTCGTGGDAVAVDGIPTGTFNVSTVAAFVAAAAGCRVAKHGNRAISSRCGSADVLRILNVPVENTPQEAAQSIEDVGLGFLFAPLFHASLKHAATPRREIGIRTIFNLAGPLTNPAGAHRQVVGVYDAALTTPIAQVLRQLGPAHSLVVHGEDGVDEISVTGPTRVAELRDGHVETYTISPIDFGISAAHPADVRGGDPEHNAELANRVLRGDLGPPRDMVLLNAGAAIYVGGKADSMARGVSLAAECIDAGRALEKLHALQRRAGGTKT